MYTVVSLNVDLAGEPNTIDFTLALFYQTCYCFIHLCELSRSVRVLTCARFTHFDPRSWRNKPGFVRFIPALRGTETLSPLFLFTPFSFVSQSSSSGNPSLHGSMSSSADFSDEDDYSLKSGSASPAPGDTLPWNLPRHERSKRKIHGGSVLDPAERAVLRIAGEQLRPGRPVFTYKPTKSELREASFGESSRLPITPHHHIVTEFAWYPVSCWV